MNESVEIFGVDLNRSVDAIFINSPLKNYDLSPRLNDFTLPVLGLGYIATWAKHKGFNIGVIDAESRGVGISNVAHTVNKIRPRWVGLNLLAPTYRHGVGILRLLEPEILVMLGGPQAKAMPDSILADQRIPRIDAMVLGEAEYRVAALLDDSAARTRLPAVKWREEGGAIGLGVKTAHDSTQWLSPDIDTLPFIDRRFFHQDPFESSDGRREANLVGSRGCPYDCSFCGAAKSANPDISIRTRTPSNICQEMFALHEHHRTTAYRFVDDLFLANMGFMRKCLPFFEIERVGERFVWDATGRINVLSDAPDELLNLMKRAGCREISLGIESGNQRVLEYIGKRISPDMTFKAVTRLTEKGIHVKGYFIFGFPTETIAELQDTADQIYRLWNATKKHSGSFRCSVFEFRPYPGTPEWDRLLKTGKYTADQLLLYEHVDLTGNGKMGEMLERDEFNFSVNLQFGEAPLALVRQTLTSIMTEQKRRLISASARADHVGRFAIN